MRIDSHIPARSNLIRILAFYFFAVSGLQAGGVYWTDRGLSLLKRMQFDGSGLETITLRGAIHSPGTNLRGIAVDPSNHHLYWADNGSDRLFVANMDGSSSAVLVSIAGGNAFPADIRLNLPANHLYWCDQLRNRIQRSSLEGLNVVEVIQNAAPSGPYFMDLDPDARKIYWGDFSDGQIYRANFDGSGRELLLTGNNQTRGVQVDPKGAMLYWVNRDDKKIHRCPLEAFRQGTIPLTHPSIKTLYSGLDTPHGLVLDIPARKLYWADTGSNFGFGSGDRSVSRGDFDGATPQEILAQGTEPWDVDLDTTCADYEEWTRRYFRRDAPIASMDPNADPDQDGLPNLYEYAFGQSPTFSESTQGLAVRTPPNGGDARDRIELVFQRRAGTSDLEYHIETSADLNTWAEAPIGGPAVWLLQNSSSLEDGMEQAVFQLVAPQRETESRFTRVRITLKP